MKFFDEKEAIAFIKSKTDTTDLSDDNLLEIIDAIFDYYDETGELDLDFDEDDEGDAAPDVDCICQYVSNKITSSALNISNLHQIIQAELDYEESLLNNL